MSTRVAITGTGAISPVGIDSFESWDSIKNGKLGISKITSFDSSNLNVHIAAEVWVATASVATGKVWAPPALDKLPALDESANVGKLNLTSPSLQKECT